MNPLHKPSLLGWAAALVLGVAAIAWQLRDDAARPALGPSALGSSAPQAGAHGHTEPAPLQRLYRWEPADVARLVVQAGDRSLVFNRVGSGARSTWPLEGDERSGLDVPAYLNLLSQARIDRDLSSVQGAAALAQLGLDAPRVTVRVEGKGGAVLTTIEAGDKLQDGVGRYVRLMVNSGNSAGETTRTLVIPNYHLQPAFDVLGLRP